VLSHASTLVAANIKIQKTGAMVSFYAEINPRFWSWR